MKSLSEFLIANRKHYFEALEGDQVQNWTVVVGNEAGDLDSAASSIAYSYLSSILLKKQTIALLQTVRSDFHLRPENDYAFSLAHLKKDHSDLFCMDDVPSNLFHQVLRSSFALVDHNRLSRPFRPTPDISPRVVAIIDHHDDEGYYEDAQKTIVVPVGSCTSLVTKHFLPFWQESQEVSSDVATLLLTGILIDTNGLKANGKAVEIDHESFKFLYPRSNLSENSNLVDQAKMENIVRNLKSLKDSISHLSSRDLLRRDYKEYTVGRVGSHNVGIASVPLNIKTWLKLDPSPKFWDAMDSWMEERHLDVLGVLFSFHSDKQGKRRRQMLWVVKNGHDELRKGLFKGLEGHKTELDLEAKPLKKEYVKGVEITKSGNVKTKAGGRAHVWKQLNTEASRKIVAPLVMAIIEGL